MRLNTDTDIIPPRSPDTNYQSTTKNSSQSILDDKSNMIIVKQEKWITKTKTKKSSLFSVGGILLDLNRPSHFITPPTPKATPTPTPTHLPSSFPSPTSTSDTHPSWRMKDTLHVQVQEVDEDPKEKDSREDVNNDDHEFDDMWIYKVIAEMSYTHQGDELGMSVISKSPTQNVNPNEELNKLFINPSTGLPLRFYLLGMGSEHHLKVKDYGGKPTTNLQKSDILLLPRGPHESTLLYPTSNEEMMLFTEAFEKGRKVLSSLWVGDCISRKILLPQENYEIWCVQNEPVKRRAAVRSIERRIENHQVFVQQQNDLKKLGYNRKIKPKPKPKKPLRILGAYNRWKDDIHSNQKSSKKKKKQQVSISNHIGGTNLDKENSCEAMDLGPEVESDDDEGYSF